MARQAQQWIAQHEAQFKSERAAVAQRLQAQLRYYSQDGREKVDERAVDTGERVLTWKMHWEGR